MTVLAVGWCLLVVGASFVLIWTARQPGRSAEPPVIVPSSIVAGQTRGLPTVILALHPHCPCSRAAVTNMETALQTPGAACDVVVLVYAPHDRPQEWTQTDTVRRLAALPGVRMVQDVDGQESAKLGMLTSGQVLVYDLGGDLRFAGGITPARGHEGSCAALDSLCELIAPPDRLAPRAGQAKTLAAASVFGCPLCESDATCPLPAQTGARP